MNDKDDNSSHICKYETQNADEIDFEERCTLNVQLKKNKKKKKRKKGNNAKRSI